MEKDLNFYQESIKKVLSGYEMLNTEQSSVELLFDDERKRYTAIRLGWLAQKRIYLCLVHIDIEDEAIIIQCNNTEDMIATELVSLGVPKEKIRLGFLPPEVQAFSDLSVSQEQFESV